MKYYLDSNNQVWSYDDGTTYEQIRNQHNGAKLKEITLEEAKNIRDPDGSVYHRDLLRHLLNMVTQGFEAVCNGWSFEAYVYDADSIYNNSYNTGGIYHSHDDEGSSNTPLDEIVKSSDYYSQAEKDTWDKQYQEALDFESTKYQDTSRCPGLLIIANTRGMPITTLAKKVIAKRRAIDDRKFKNIGYKAKYIEMIDKVKEDKAKLEKLNKEIKSWLIYERDDDKSN